MARRELAFQVWDHLESGASIMTLGSELQIDDLSTLKRLGAELGAFRKGEDDGSIARKVGWAQKTVAQHRMWWRQYERNKHPRSLEIHFGEMTLLAAELRVMTLNPDVRRRPYTGDRSTWFLHGFDWRVSPIWWLAVVSPPVDLVGSFHAGHECLLSHLADSEFLKHYRELEAGAAALEKEWDKYLSHLDSVHADEFSRITDIIGEFFVDGTGHAPGEVVSRATVDELKEALSDCLNQIPALVDDFRGYHPALDTECDRLEHLLQQVYDALDPAVISLDIEKGECSRCSFQS